MMLAEEPEKTDDAGLKKQKHPGKTSPYEVPEIAILPFELLEMMACAIDSGEDLVNWLTACEGSVVNLDDLMLIQRLPQILGHQYVSLKDLLDINVPLSEEECEVIDNVSRFYTSITFGARCLTTFASLKLSSRPTVCLDLSNSKLDNQFACDVVDDF
jgi:hypothetical protein